MSKIVKAIIMWVVGGLILFKGGAYYASYGSNPVIETQYFTITGLGALIVITVIAAILSCIGWVFFSELVREKLRERKIKKVKHIS